MPSAAQEKRNAMAKVFATTQTEMSNAVDELTLVRRRPAPYVNPDPPPVVRGPFPTDDHLVPSGELAPKPYRPNFRLPPGGSMVTNSTEKKPWSTFEKAEPVIFDSTMRGEAPDPNASRPPLKLDEEMWRTRYNEWNLQKNAYNPDIAAQMRTNVRKAAALTMVDPFANQDPARTSENVRMALEHSCITGDVELPPKPKVTVNNVFPSGF